MDGLNWEEIKILEHNDIETPVQVCVSTLFCAARQKGTMRIKVGAHTYLIKYVEEDKCPHCGGDINIKC